MAIQRASLVWARITGVDGLTKDRACVVTRLGAGTIEVVYGQEKKWGSSFHFVSMGSLLGRSFPLTKDTHFCDAQTIPVADVVRVCFDKRTKPPTEALCPPSSFPKLEAIAMAARLRLAGPSPSTTATGSTAASGSTTATGTGTIALPKSGSDPNDAD